MIIRSLALARWSVVAVLPIAGCTDTESAPLNDAERRAIEGMIKTQTHQILTAAEAVDPVAVLAPFSQRPELISTFEGKVDRGYEAFANNVRTSYTALRSQDFGLTTEETRVLNRDVAVTTVYGPHTATDSGGIPSPTKPFAATIVWQREDGKWKIIAIHQSMAQ